MLTLLEGLLPSKEENVEEGSPPDDEGDRRDDGEDIREGISGGVDEVVAEQNSGNVTTVMRLHVERLFTFVVMWSIGALLEVVDRNRLEDYMRSLSKPRRMDLPDVVEGSAFDYVVDDKGKVFQPVTTNDSE